MATRVQAPRQKGKSRFLGPLNTIPVDQLYEASMQGPIIRKVLWVFVLVLVYIGNNHLASMLVYRLEKANTEVEDLRVDYNSTKYGYMFNSKQSEVATRMKPYQVEESSVPPRKIVLKAAQEKQ